MNNIITGFNPHPAHRPGATGSHQRRWWYRVCFNPHPAHRPGATCIHQPCPHLAGFQSSPGTQAGCYVGT
jgi:hypothetical protein